MLFVWIDVVLSVDDAAGGAQSLPGEQFWAIILRAWPGPVYAWARNVRDRTARMNATARSP